MRTMDLVSRPVGQPAKGGQKLTSGLGGKQIRALQHDACILKRKKALLILMDVKSGLTSVVEVIRLGETAPWHE
jgi:hypothetical protein